MLEKLKELLGEELSEQVTEKLGTIELGIVNDGSLVPADKHDSMKAEHKATTEQLQKLQNDIKQLEGSTASIEELKEQLKAKDEEMEAFKSDVTSRETKRTKQQTYEKVLEEAGFLKSSIKLLAKDADYDAMTLDENGKIVNVNTYIDPLKESYKDLVVARQPLDSTPPAGDPPKDEGGLTDQELFDLKMKGDK